jgi:predicted N-acetyltransferase YhbS
VSITIRQAEPREIAALEALIAESVRKLSIGYYTPAQMEGALGTAFGVDTQLIRDGTYFVAEVDHLVVGCGGWSCRKTLFGSDNVGAEKNDEWLDPVRDPARIRAFFVHPSWSRQGIGSRIMQLCEVEARAAGFSRLELAATLPGEPLYRAHGFEALEYFSIPLRNGEVLPLVRMTKNLAH